MERRECKAANRYAGSGSAGAHKSNQVKVLQKPRCHGPSAVGGAGHGGLCGRGNWVLGGIGSVIRLGVASCAASRSGRGWRWLRSWREGRRRTVMLKVRRL